MWDLWITVSEKTGHWLIPLMVIGIVSAVATKLIPPIQTKKGRYSAREDNEISLTTIIRAPLTCVTAFASMALSMILIAQIFLGTGVPVRVNAAAGEKAMMDRYDMYMTNEVANALDGVLTIEKVWWLNDSDVIAPEPNQACFGSTDDPASLQWLLDEASEVLGIDDFVFDPNVEIRKWSKVNYYLDETIFAITWQVYRDYCVYTYAEVKIAHGSQFRRFLAGGAYGSDKQFFPTQMASDVNAVLASAGDFYKFRNEGTIVYNGEVKRVNSKTVDTCFVDDKGDLIFSYKGELTTVEDAQRFVDENNIRFSIAFGPVLVDNGVRCEPRDYALGEPNGFFPRAALCQMDERHYLVMLVGWPEGTTYLENVPDIHEFAERVVETGCEKAYTLDGGQTATVVLGDVMANPLQYGCQRAISDIFYFATALPEGD